MGINHAKSIISEFFEGRRFIFNGEVAAVDARVEVGNDNIKPTGVDGEFLEKGGIAFNGGVGGVLEGELAIALLKGLIGFVGEIDLWEGAGFRGKNDITLASLPKAT